MYTVSLPLVVESFHRALNEVLAPYFTGQSMVIMADNVQLYKTDLLYNNSIFGEEPHADPFVAFIGNRAGERLTKKTTDPKGNRAFGYEVRQTVYRTVFVGVGASKVFNPPPYVDPENPRPATMEDVEAIWSQLLLVLENQYHNFASRGIYQPILPAIPTQVQHPDYLLVTGELKTEIRFTLTRGN